MHAYLVSLYRSGRDQTQREMAEQIGLTRHRVWSALRELADAELVRPIRYGLGRPNGYTLLGLEQADLDGRQGAGNRRPASPESASGQSGNLTRARQPENKKHDGRRPETGQKVYARPSCRRCSGRGRHCDRCSACLPGPHDRPECYTVGYART